MLDAFDVFLANIKGDVAFGYFAAVAILFLYGVLFDVGYIVALVGKFFTDEVFEFKSLDWIIGGDDAEDVLFIGELFVKQVDGFVLWENWVVADYESVAELLELVEGDGLLLAHGIGFLF